MFRKINTVNYFNQLKLLLYRPFRLYSQNNDSQLWIKVTKLVNHQIYMEGTVNQLLEMTGWEGSRILYFGDQIYSDLADLTLNYGWRTGKLKKIAKKLLFY